MEREWIDPRYARLAAELRAREKAAEKAGLPLRPQRGFVIVSKT
ncbi:hypothetical protein [Streptomyces sp. NPDC050485]